MKGLYGEETGFYTCNRCVNCYGDNVAAVWGGTNTNIDWNTCQPNAGTTPELDKYFPVGSVYITTSGDFNPNTAFGGTWEKFAQGKTLFGMDEGDTAFASNGLTGGEKEHTLTVNEMPSHKHVGTQEISSSSPAGTIKSGTGPWQEGPFEQGTMIAEFTPETNSQTVYNPGKSPLSRKVQVDYGISNGGGQPHNNLPPYIVVIMWKRTA